MRVVKTFAAGALALAMVPALPAVARAQAPYGYGEPGAWEAPQPQNTLVRVTPPPWGVVYLYEGRRLVGRFDRPGSLWLPMGRSYRVVAMRGDQQVWSGFAETAGSTLDLIWPAPRAFGRHVPRPYPAQPYAEEPSARDYTQQPSPYAGSPFVAPLIPDQELRQILHALDATEDEGQKLSIVQAAARRFSFTGAAVDRLLARFPSEHFRVRAFDALAPRVIDRMEPPPQRPVAPPVEEGRMRTPW
jgi:hypothetical protein